MRYSCCDRFRRNAIDAHPTLNAIDWIEVGDLVRNDLNAAEQGQFDSLPPRLRGPLLWQRKLTVGFVNPLSGQHAGGLTPNTIRISGGERVRRIRVDLLLVGAQSIQLRATPAGDFSHYSLSLERSATDPRPPPGFDPVLSRIEFSFKVDCPTEFDCKTDRFCPPEEVELPDIDYLAKDYASFRRLILDRMAQLVPDWRERNPADLGVVLAELLAYVGDHLSYQQDAVATEAYLGTARRRVSVRRHALLVDYFMHDGCNARAWVQVGTSADDVTIAPGNIAFFSRVERLPRRVALESLDAQAAIDARAEWFEPLESLKLFRAHERIDFYTWGDDRCCLPRGATRATLAGHLPDLAAGMVLVFEEVIGPLTGDPTDSDPGHRHAVRLTRVVHTEDGAPLADPLDGSEITAIEWADADALPFPLCVSSLTDSEHGSRLLHGVSVARGNIVLVDHGRTVSPQERLDPVPEPQLYLAFDSGDARCDRPPREPVPPRYRPELKQAPMTQAGAFDHAGPASAAFILDMRDVRPSIAVGSTLGTETTDWRAVRDLLASDRTAPEFVVEVEHDGSTRLRFGDGEHGLRPRSGSKFTAVYRTGNGAAGNVGADSIVHAVTLDARIVNARNPLPAALGQDPETAEQVRRRAPQAFRKQERAVTPADYEEVTLRHQDVQRAAATLRWTGSWHTAFITVDRIGGEALDAQFEQQLGRHVERFRLAGQDLEFDEPRYVPLEIELFVCVQSDYFRSDVKARLLAELGSRVLPDGRRGLFHPDNFSFGQTIYLSPILAAAHAVAGVASANVVVFQRQGMRDRRYLDDGRLALGCLEIARLDNDPDFPERGVLRIRLGGGK